MRNKSSREFTRKVKGPTARISCGLPFLERPGAMG
jgi:hypothetical protein